ncbi:MAG TPA: phosphoserine phosphatase SerB [Burkholderiales bacterium]|nr:phosphoserine phosphatase SerB [Burkholderiales bacterium]
MNLVLQGPSTTRSLLQDRFKDLYEVAPHAFKVPGQQRDRRIEAWCEDNHVDFAWMEEGRKFSDLKLVAMDMDSTLITIECIDEIGDFCGKKAEIAAITEQAMRGELDYPQSLRKRVSLLEGLPEDSLLRVYEDRLRFTPGAEQLVAACKRNGVKLLLVSGGFTYFTDRLKARLGLDYTISNTLEVRGGKLTGQLVGDIVDADAKARKFLSVMQALGATRMQTVAMGDGANDLRMMKQAGLSVAFRAKPVVRAQADCALNWSGLDAVVNLFE